MISSSLVLLTCSHPLSLQDHRRRLDIPKRVPYSVVAVDGSLASPSASLTLPIIQTVITKTLEDTTTITALATNSPMMKETTPNAVLESSSTKMSTSISATKIPCLTSSVLLDPGTNILPTNYVVVNPEGTGAQPEGNPTMVTRIITGSNVSTFWTASLWRDSTTASMQILPATSSSTATHPSYPSQTTHAAVTPSTTYSEHSQPNNTTNSIYQSNPKPSTSYDRIWNTYPCANTTLKTFNPCKTTAGSSLPSGGNIPC